MPPVKAPIQLPLFHRELLLPALLALVAWTGGAYLLHKHVLAPHNEQQVRSATTALASEVADRVAEQFAQRSRYLQALSEATGAAPSGSRIQVFRAQDIRVGAGERPRLNFALVDLLERSAAGGQQALEFLRTGSGEGWQLHGATRTSGGVALVSEPLAELERVFTQFGTAAGRLRILQQFPEGPEQSLWEAGQGAGAAVSVPVDGSYVRVELRPSAAFAAEHSTPASWLYTVAAAGLLATLALLYRHMPRHTPAPWQSGERPVRRRSDYPELAAAGSISARNRGPDTGPGEPQRDSGGYARPGTPTDFPRRVFRAYDIRGIAGTEIDEPFAYQLGRALGSLAQHAGEELLMVGRDGRNSSELLARCLVEGILDSGCNSVDLGLVPSPILYYACARGKNGSSGVMVTASHNPAEYNGFKIILRGRPLADEKLQRLRQLMIDGPFHEGKGSNRQQDIQDLYIEEIFNDVALAGAPHLVVDAGNGATSQLAPRLFEQLGCEVTPLFCEIDGDFPNHPPDPSRPENLAALVEKVKEAGADLGVALDGDGDRVTLVSAGGRIVWADQLVMLLARDILARKPGENVVFDVKSSRALGELVSQYGGRPVMWKTGHAPMKTKMLETGAILGGELSGHIFIKDRWFGFDDGIYAAARILEIMALREQGLDELLDSLPRLASTPEILVPVEEDEKFALVERLREQGDFGEADVDTTDGLRIEYPNGWGLVRASNTGAALTLRFEAENEQALEEIRRTVIGQLQQLNPGLPL
ncbi:phosphomannomutase/phosphoglucomutase [Microbulbifer yueqingensis]|uniref:phosphomannomutase n=1 Tax=Microbulbifer yueqingensis TaxID=658219 RepID=A0A1G9BJM6_9GAMM|nr:phosphomannomutase/phosphoglucomutase [Microbulbifer yueqingensis]SDK39692.1 phosphomannomutase / phosphoglucomutase [Microbulbifer yueqingensis]